MDWKIPLSDITFEDEEAAAVQDVLKSRWLTMGEVTQRFEEDFSNYMGSKHAIAVTNCTAALHLACLAVGLGPGDEVILPSLTFVATANAVRYVGATPVFADIEGEQDFDIAVKGIEQCLSKRTRAIIVMHYGGYACDMDGILSLAKKYGLVVIEDAAHAVGSELRDRKLGTIGKIGCYSFFSNKNITTCEGGMLVTDDDSIAEKLRLLRSHGMTSLTLDRYKGHAWSYDVIATGYNYRIDEIRSALGIVQLGKLERNNAHRRQLTSLYRDHIQEFIPEIIVPFAQPRGISACHLLPILLPTGFEREHFMERMKSNGIQTSIHYPPIHRFSAYSDLLASSHGSLSVTEEVASREVTLPLFATLTDEDVFTVVQSVRESLKHSGSG